MTTSEILDATITTADLADASVNSEKIIDASIATIDLSDGSVNSNKILDETIVAGDIATGAITSSEILNATILTEDMANLSVSTAKIADNAIDKDKIAADIAGNGLAQNIDGSLEVGVDGSSIELTNDKLNIKDMGVVNAMLANDAITNNKVADDAIQTENILNGTIIAIDVAADAIDKDKLNPDVAGEGLGQSGDGSLVARVDDVTIEIIGIGEVEMKLFPLSS